MSALSHYGVIEDLSQGGGDMAFEGGGLAYTIMEGRQSPNSNGAHHLSTSPAQFQSPVVNDPTLDAYYPPHAQQLDCAIYPSWASPFNTADFTTIAAPFDSFPAFSECNEADAGQHYTLSLAFSVDHLPPDEVLQVNARSTRAASFISNASSAASVSHSETSRCASPSFSEMSKWVGQRRKGYLSTSG